MSRIRPRSLTTAPQARDIAFASGSLIGLAAVAMRRACSMSFDSSDRLRLTLAIALTIRPISCSTAACQEIYNAGHPSTSPDTRALGELAHAIVISDFQSGAQCRAQQED